MAPSASPSSPGNGALPPSSVPALPQSIKSIREILDEKVTPNQLIDILGLVRDFRPPVITGGTGMLVNQRTKPYHPSHWGTGAPNYPSDGAF